MSTSEPFLSRWSRLKRDGAATVEPADNAAAEPAVAVEPAVAAKPAAPAEFALPDIDSLTATSDFTPFLAPEVPAALHQQALRKLWLSDPVFARHDGLTDYADDYHTPSYLGSVVKTAYRVGRGLLAEPDPEVAAEPQPTAEDGPMPVEDEHDAAAPSPSVLASNEPLIR